MIQSENYILMFGFRNFDTTLFHLKFWDKEYKNTHVHMYLYLKLKWKWFFNFLVWQLSHTVIKLLLKVGLKQNQPGCLPSKPLHFQVRDVNL